MLGSSRRDSNPEESASPAPETAADMRQVSGDADKAAEAHDQLLRLKAEFDNAKKRLERDKAEAIRYANEKLLSEILHIVDNFDRAMASLSEGHDPEKVKKGLGLAQDDLHKILERHGVQAIKSVGAPFDPQMHEAVAVVEGNDVEDGMIVDEIQRGYLLNGRLLRPSRVRIAKKKD